jgi:acetylornithine deacetylase
MGSLLRRVQYLGPVAIDITELTRQLVAIDSVNPDLVPGGNGEAEIAAFVARWARERGLDVEVVEPVPGRPSVLATARGTGGGRSLLLYAHTDTVGVAGMTDPFGARVAGGRLYGRGAMDMKGSLAACMAATVALAGQELAGDVVLAAVADEENASIGAAAVAKRVRTDAAIITEPVGGGVCIAHKGFVWLRVTITGRAAHGSRPAEGIDAIAKMGRILTGVEDLDRSLRSGRGHLLLGTGSAHASLIEGGQEMSSYPERCVLGVERRTIPGEDAHLARAEMERIVAEARAQDPALDARVEVTLARSPYEVDRSEPIVQEVLREAETYGEGHIAGSAGWMDSAVFAEAGIPSVIVGPGGEGLHAVEEWVDLASVARLASTLEAVARRFCA